jgi:septal ring factor EnvC (AmiA/AmiB activator)
MKHIKDEIKKEIKDLEREIKEIEKQLNNRKFNLALFENKLDDLEISECLIFQKSWR